MGTLLDDMLNTPVVAVRRTWRNVRGQRTPTDTEFPLWTNLQSMKAERVRFWGLDAASQGFVAYFGADPGLTVDDLIRHPDGRTLLVLGPARDMGGQGEAWALDLVARASPLDLVARS